jgi:glycosyltransferase involved in cell wall biosynthesis
MGMIKICYVLSRLVDGGPSNQLFYILTNLDDEFDPSVITLSPEYDTTARPKFEEAGIPVQSLGLGRMGGVLRGGSALKRAVEEKGADIVHSQGIRPDLLSALYLEGYPRICNIQNYAYDDYPMKHGALLGYPMAWLHLRAVGRIDHPVACSKSVSAELAPHKIDVRVIQNAVDTEWYRPASAPKKRRLRAKLNLPEEGHVTVSVGSLIPRKEAETVIEGFPAGGVEEENILLILGDGPLRDKCERLAEDSDAEIRLLGHVEDVRSHLQAADLFVSASRAEGLPCTVMEALSTGLPVVLSDIPPHREFFPGDPPPGQFFPVGNSQALGEAIEEIRREDTEGLARQARDLAVQNFGAEQMSEKYQRLYREITTNGMPRQMA